jgi:hypothetical protein
MLKKVSSNENHIIYRSLLAAGEYNSYDQLHIAGVNTFDQLRSRAKRSLCFNKIAPRALESTENAHVQPSHQIYQIFELALHLKARRRYLPRSWTISKRQIKRCRSYMRAIFIIFDTCTHQRVVDNSGLYAVQYGVADTLHAVLVICRRRLPTITRASRCHHVQSDTRD